MIAEGGRGEGRWRRAGLSARIVGFGRGVLEGEGRRKGEDIEGGGMILLKVRLCRGRGLGDALLGKSMKRNVLLLEHDFSGVLDIFYL